MDAAYTEHRRSVRVRQDGAVRWRRRGSTQDCGVACLLEASEDGLAFAWRGDWVPRGGELLEVQRGGGEASYEPIVVRWADRVHEDLIVVGAELYRAQEFPPAMRAEAKRSSGLSLTAEELRLIDLSLAA